MDGFTFIAGIAGAAFVAVGVACMVAVWRRQAQNALGRIGLVFLFIWACLLTSAGVRLLVQFINGIT